MIHRVSGLFRLQVLLVGLCGALALAGCGRSDVDLAAVCGQVTLDGEPVRGLFIVFQPPRGKPSYAMLDADGKFTLQYNVENAGAVVGKQEVFLKVPGSDEMGELPAGVSEPTKIPNKFRQVFETVEVKSGRNEFKLDLKSAN